MEDRSAVLRGNEFWRFFARIAGLVADSVAPSAPPAFLADLA